MSHFLTGVNAIIAGNNDVAVLAEVISSLDFDMLQEANKGSGRALNITRDQFDLFIARQGRNFMDAGLLDDELVPTGTFISAVN